MSASMIAFVVTLALGGTQAFFSDEEVSEGNTFSAGAIDLQVDNTSYGFDWNREGEDDPTGEWGPNPNNSWAQNDLTNQLFFSFVDLKPGDYGEDTISLHVDNNDAYACMAFDLTATPENGQNEPEAEVDNTAGADEGELQDHLSFLFWNDDGDNVFEIGEEVLEDLSGLPGSVFGGDWLAIAEGGETPLEGDTTHYIGKGWCFGEMTRTPVPNDANTPPDPDTNRIGFTCSGAGDHNEAQTDGITVDVGFYAVQSRNNDDFSCSALPPLDGSGTSTPTTTPEVFVGAVLGDYSAPATTTCDVIVSGTSSIQTELDAVEENGTVCVADDYDGAGDDIALRIETTGVTLLSLTQGTALDVPVVLSADGVTVTGFTGTIGQAESASEIAAFYLDNDATNATLSFNEVSGGVGAAILTETGASLGGGLITNNVLSGATQGIYLNPHTGTMVIEYNDIDNNAAGIGGFNGATVRFNEFEHTTPGSEAIGIDESFEANPGVINFNNFLDDMEINTYDTGLAGTVTSAIDAENNFFSTSGAAQTDDTAGGTIDFTPEAGSAYAHN